MNGAQKIINKNDQFKKISIVGYGYWGRRLHTFIDEESIKVSSIFTSKSFNEVQSIVHSSEMSARQNAYILYDYSNTSLLAAQDFLFIATGPLFHHDLIRELENDVSYKPQTKIWIEKPFVINKLNPIKHNNTNLFVDYPYTSENLADTEFVQKISLKKPQDVGIEIYSKYTYNRNYHIIYDFLPHCLTIVSSFNNDKFLSERYKLDLLNYFIDHNNNIIKYIIRITSESGMRFTISFGIDPEGTSRIFIPDKIEGNLSSFFAKADSDESSSCLSDLYPNPVNKNINRFILDDYSEDSIQNRSLRFHERIYELTSNLLEKN